MNQELINTGGGATRSKTNVRFDLIPAQTMNRLAQRFALGAEMHGENNWKLGDWRFVVACFNHLEHHLNKLKQSGNAGDDNLGAILWNATAIGWYEACKTDEYIKALQFMAGEIAR